ncbi:MAG: N-6 DNA methylase [Candidatus Tectomicrobia bacterium]|nr:N-6 DNA methylase [Candidatus Tectomicrobia bacterium]
MAIIMIPQEIAENLKDTREQQTVVGPLVVYLMRIGWRRDQIVFGRSEWRVPKSPSEATRREKGQSFNGFPVDIAIFDDPSTVGDPRHLLFIVECKPETETAGVSQLEWYFGSEPHVQLGIWANNPTASASAIFLYREADGRLVLKRRKINDLPRPDVAIRLVSERLTFGDLITPTDIILKKMMEDLLDKIAISDSNVTRREDQLDQVCNLLLLKLESDKEGKSDPSAPVFFRPMESAARTATGIRARYRNFVDLYPEVFVTEQDKTLRFSDGTLASCVEQLSGLKLIDLGVSTISLAFQVLRSEALKQGEGQYFTPQAVIEAGVRLMEIEFQDLILDPACGTGGFLVEAMLEMQRTHPTMPLDELSRWAQTHVFGIDKDAIGVKLTKAIMQIAGDGSAHCVRGDSIRTHNWSRDFPHLAHANFKDNRFTVITTNPPFGKNLRIAAQDSRLATLELAKKGTNTYSDLEIGLLFLERAYHWLKKGGRLGIILPETYFFSPNYSFVFDWIKTRFRPLIVVNIPMEAFQGFCRAKTNFYIFEKIGQ